jgi:hypothetical protein
LPLQPPPSHLPLRRRRQTTTVYRAPRLTSGGALFRQTWAVARGGRQARVDRGWRGAKPKRLNPKLGMTMIVAIVAGALDGRPTCGGGRRARGHAHTKHDWAQIQKDSWDMLLDQQPQSFRNPTNGQ